MLSFEAGTYKLTGCPNGGSDTTYRLGMNLNTGTTYDTGNGAVMTLNSSMTNRAVWLIIYAGTTVSNLTFYPMLIKGTEEKPYEPYGAMPSPNYPSKVVTVGQNVNIFDKDNANTLNAIINGTTKQIANFDTCRSIYISCDNNEDYTISRKAGTRFVVGTTTNTPVLNATCNQIVQNNTADSITIKTTENDNYLVVFYYNSGTDTLTEEEIRNSIKIEKGLVATPYSPYGQGSVEISVDNGLETTDTNYQSYTKVLPIQKEFVKIGEVEDTFVKVDGKWYEKHYIYKYIFTGNENIKIQYNNRIILKTEENNIEKCLASQSHSEIAKIYCNIATASSNNVTWNNITENLISISRYDETNAFYISLAGYTETSKFLEILKGNTLYYILETPELISCTAEQEEILNSFYTYKNVTNISMSGIGKIKIIYKKDQQTINKNYENRLAALEAAIIS